MSRSTSLLDDREESYSYRGHQDEDTHRASSFGPGEGFTGAASTFYQKHRKAILIALGSTVAVILLIVIIAVAASKKGNGDDPVTPPSVFTQTTLGGMTAWQGGTDGPTLFYLPDVNGWGAAAQSLATDYVNAGFQVWALDYFNGATRDTCTNNCTVDNSIASVRLAVADARQRWPGQLLFATGYCYGGGVGVALSYGGSNASFDAVVVAHAAYVTVDSFRQVASPLFAVMPQNDNSFNSQAATYMGTVTCSGCRGHVVEMKVYPGVSHGFAVVAAAGDANAVAQKAAAFADTVAFLNARIAGVGLSAPSPRPKVVKQSPKGFNISLGGMNTYEVGSGNLIVLYLQDAAGWRPAATDLADAYAAKGFHVYLPDYFDGRTSAGWNVDNSTARVRLAVYMLRTLYPTALIFTTGYCWGGGVGVRLASGPNRVDASAVAHASLVTSDYWNVTTAPIFAAMPQTDPSFNDQVPTYMASLTCWPLSQSCLAREAAFRVYPGVGHGFAVVANVNDSNAVAQKQAALDDTVYFFNSHTSLTPALPTQPTLPSTGVVPPMESSTGVVPPMESSTGTASPVLPSSSAVTASPDSPSTSIITAFPVLPSSSTGAALLPTKTTLGDMTAYRIGTSGPILLYLPDINGVKDAAMALATQFATAGFQVWVLDFFDGGDGRSVPGLWTIDNSTLRTRLAIADIRQQFPTQPVYSTGYCWGGGVGVQVASGSPMVDVSAVAHAAGVNLAYWNSALSPILAVMPQNDPSFNNQAGSFMDSITCAGCRGHVAELKVYPGVSHGFAVVASLSDANAVKQKAAAFADTVAFFQQQLYPSPSTSSVTSPSFPSDPQGVNITLWDMNTYHVGSGNRILVYLLDVFGWREAATDLADAYAAQGFSVYMPDYCNGGRCAGGSADNSTVRILGAIATLRQQYPTALVFSTGYCYGGGIGLTLASMPGVVNVSVVAHASAPASTLFANLTTPLLVVMPQNDNGFNSRAASYINATIQWPSKETAFKVYPGVGHGFAVAVAVTDANAVQQKQQSFIDTVQFFNQHS